jgi:hypothetical protein
MVGALAAAKAAAAAAATAEATAAAQLADGRGYAVKLVLQAPHAVARTAATVLKLGFGSGIKLRQDFEGQHASA